MRKIIVTFLAFFLIAEVHTTFAADASCPKSQDIQALTIFSADPRDHDNFWDAQTNSFNFAGHVWNVGVQNFQTSEASSQVAIRVAQDLLTSTSLISDPKKIRSPDNVNNICIYAWNGSYGKDLLIVAYEY